MMDVNNMKVSDFRKLEHREWDEETQCDSIIILPAKVDVLGLVKYRVKEFIAKLFHLDLPDIWQVGHIHDSGYRCMDFVAVKDNKPLCLLSGCSDVIHIEGIGGYGHNWYRRFGNIPSSIEPGDWNIDCLRKSGLLRLWTNNHKKQCLCGAALSSFEIYSFPR